MADNDMERHWSAVGEKVRDRRDDNLLAGDDSPYYRYKAQLFSQKFLPQVPVQDMAVLDVGCGPGGTLRWMAKQRPKRLVGCDQSSEMVRLAMQNVPEAEVVQIDGEHLPFQDHEFDVVMTVTVLQHNPDDRRAKLVAEICRVSGGDILLFEDTSTKMPITTGSRPGVYQNFFGRPVGWYAGACNSHGFDLIEVKRLDTFVSRRVSLFLWSHLDRGARAEGSQFSRSHLAIEREILPITKYLDKLVKNSRGENTMMRFRRRTNANA